MALTIDSKAVLGAILADPDVFDALRSDLPEFARKALIKQIKHKTTDLARFRAIYEAIGKEIVQTVLDGFEAKDLIGLIKKIDANSSFAKNSGSPQEARQHIVALASGERSPTPKTEKVVVAKAPKVRKEAPPKIGVVLGSEVHSGVRPRATRSKKA